MIIFISRHKLKLTLNLSKIVTLHQNARVKITKTKQNKIKHKRIFYM